MAALGRGILVLFQILLFWQSVAWADVCVYEEFDTGREFTKYCGRCCETDCCEESSGSGGAIGGAIAGIAVVAFIIVWVTCRVVPSCPLAKYRRNVVIRRTIVTAAVGVPANRPPSNFQNPLAYPRPGVTAPQGPPPSYDQAVPPNFTPLPASLPAQQGPATKI